MYPYREDDTERSKYQEKIQWEKTTYVAEKPKLEKIVDHRIGKKTRKNTYFEYLVKWKGHLIEDSSWVSEVDVQKHGRLVQESINFVPREI